MSPKQRAAIDRRRRERIVQLAREHRTAERKLERALRAARAKGDSLRELSAASGIPRVTLQRRLDGGSTDA